MILGFVLAGPAKLIITWSHFHNKHVMIFGFVVAGPRKLIITWLALRSYSIEISIEILSFPALFC